MQKFGKHFRDNKSFVTSADSDQPAHPHERGQYNLHADCSIWWKNVSGYNITIPSNIAQLCITHTLRGLVSVVRRILVYSVRFRVFGGSPQNADIRGKDFFVVVLLPELYCMYFSFEV